MYQGHLHVPAPGRCGCWTSDPAIYNGINHPLVHCTTQSLPAIIHQINPSSSCCQSKIWLNLQCWSTCWGMGCESAPANIAVLLQIASAEQCAQAGDVILSPEVAGVTRGLCSVDPLEGNNARLVSMSESLVVSSGLCMRLCSALHCPELPCTALHCPTLHCPALHCPTLPCPAVHFPALHSAWPLYHILLAEICHAFALPYMFCLYVQAASPTVPCDADFLTLHPVLSWIISLP